MLEKSLHYLSQLKQNNNREWFHANKAAYNEARAEFDAVTADLIAAVSRFDLSVGSLEPKECTFRIFRIFRDIRFSPDKTPYKTHFGAYICAGGGRKSTLAGYYLHLDPDAPFCSGGLYMPQPDVLKEVRKELHYNFDTFSAIVQDKAFRACFGAMTGGALKKIPAGFDKGSPAAEYLKFKDFCVERPLKKEEILSEKFIGTAAGIFKTMKPFNDFFNAVVRGM